MSENGQVMLYRDEVEQLLHNLQYVRGRFEIVCGSREGKKVSAEDGVALGILDKWIDRIKGVLKWRRTNC